MRPRKAELGARNIIGAHVTARRKHIGMKQSELLARLQVADVDMDASGLSKLEGQVRHVTDIELVAISTALDVSVSYLLTGKEM